MSEQSDVNKIKAEEGSRPDMTINQSRFGSIGWILISCVLAGIVVTVTNLVLLIYDTFEPGPLMVFWIVPALLCSVLLSVVLTNLKARNRRLSSSMLSAVLSVPISLFFLYVSIMAFFAYGLATSP